MCPCLCVYLSVCVCLHACVHIYIMCDCMNTAELRQADQCRD